MVSWGKVHTYLGMTLDYSTPGQVKISMLDFIEEIFTAFNKAEWSWDKKKCSTQQSVQDQWRLWEAQHSQGHYWVSQSYHEDAVCYQMCPSQHMHLHCIPYYACAWSRLGWLEEVGALDEVYQRYTQTASDPKCQQKWHFKVVGGCLVHCPSQHVRTFRRQSFFWMWIPNCELNQAESEYPKLNRNRSSRCWQFHASDLLDLVLSWSTRIQGEWQHLVSG